MQSKHDVLHFNTDIMQFSIDILKEHYALTACCYTIMLSFMELCFLYAIQYSIMYGMPKINMSCFRLHSLAFEIDRLCVFTIELLHTTISMVFTIELLHTIISMVFTIELLHTTICMVFTE